MRRMALGMMIGILFLLGAVSLSSPALSEPPGNNGTVKVDGVPFDSHPDNEPHVGCPFQVDLTGFDEDPGLFADVSFALQPPTLEGRTIAVSGNQHLPIVDGAASQTYTLSFTGAPHPQQGYHVKLTIHADGSQGADTKFKVFFVTGCNPPVVTTTVPPTTLPPTTVPPTTLPPTTLGTTPTTLGTTVTTAAPRAQGQGPVTPAVGQEPLARTGASTVPLLALGLGLAGVGTLLVRRSGLS